MLNMRSFGVRNDTDDIILQNITFLNSSEMDLQRERETKGNETILFVCPVYNRSYPDFTQIHSVYAAIIIVYVVVIMLAIFGNMLVIWTIWRHKSMHTVTNYYIVNLALSDLLVSVFVMPLKLMEYTVPCRWNVFSSDGLCAFMSFTLPIFVFASILTLVAISLERYYAIVHPLSAMKVNSKSRTKKIIAVTWIIPIIVTTPYLYYKSVGTTVQSQYGAISRQYCQDRFREIDGNTGLFMKCFFTLLFVVMYFTPMLVIIATCTKIAMSLLKPMMMDPIPVGNHDNKRRSEANKRKVARMVIVVAVAFIVSWTPQFGVSIITLYQPVNFMQKGHFFFTMLMTHLFGFVNSCVNPFIYTAMSEKFRNSFKKTLCSLFCNVCRCGQEGKSGTCDLHDRSTAIMSSATRSFIEPEEEPLQHGDENKLKVMRYRRNHSDESLRSANNMNNDKNNKRELY